MWPKARQRKLPLVQFADVFVLCYCVDFFLFCVVVGKTCQQEMSSIMFYNWCVEKMGGGREAGLQKYLEALRAKTPRGQSFWACFLLAAYNQLQLTLQVMRELLARYGWCIDKLFNAVEWATERQ